MTNGQSQTDMEPQGRSPILHLLNQMLLTPNDFCFKWGIDYEELAEICCVSKSTTYHWLGGQTSRREAGKTYQRIMAITDVLLENSNQVEPLLNDWLNRR